jgi:hypothetical protein
MDRVTVGGATSLTCLSKLYRKLHDISSLHVNHCELLVKLTINTLEKRYVVSQWWFVRPHGRYHHGSDDHCHAMEGVDGTGIRK